MLGTDFLSTQIRHRDYDSPRAVHTHGMSSSETAIKVIAVVAALFLLLASISTGNPVVLLVMLSVTVIGCVLTFMHPDKIIFFLGNLRRAPHSRNHQVVVVDSGRPKVYSSYPYGVSRNNSAASSAGGTVHVAVGGGHAPKTHTTRPSSYEAPHVAVGGGHAPKTHTTRPSAYEAPHVAVGGGHAPKTHTTLGGGGKSHVAVGGGHNPSKERTSDGRVPVGSRTKK